MKVISLSIFGYRESVDDSFNNQSFTFKTFLRLFSVSLRAYKVLYPDWIVYVSIQSEAYNAFKEYFDYLKEIRAIEFQLMESKELCRNMLWRLSPVNFADYTICRDVDSLPTYRERQAVDIWIYNDTLFHAINDNTEHNVALMGGMIGFKKGAFDYGKVDDMSVFFNYNQKGSDQLFLCDQVYPIVRNSITEHRIKGMPLRSDNPYCYDKIEDINVKDVNLSDSEKKISNDIINYIGQSYFIIDYEKEVKNNFHIYHTDYVPELPKNKIGAYTFYSKYGDRSFNKSLLKIEKNYPEIFYWV